MWTSTTLQPPSSMRRPLHSAVHPNSGLSCLPILQDVAHIKPLLPRNVSITCGRGVSCAGQCSAIGAHFCPTGKGTRGEVNCDQTNNFSGQVYAVVSLVPAGTTGRTRTRKKMRTLSLRKSGQGGSLHQPLYLPG